LVWISGGGFYGAPPGWQSCVEFVLSIHCGVLVGLPKASHGQEVSWVWQNFAFGKGGDSQFEFSRTGTPLLNGSGYRHFFAGMALGSA